MRKSRTLVIIRYLFCAGLFIVPIFYLLLSLAILAATGQYSYKSILSWYSAWRPDGFSVDVIAARCFTPGWYDLLRAYRLPLMAGIIGLLVVYLLFSRRIGRFLWELPEEMGKIGSFMVRTFRELNGRERSWLLLLFAGILAYRLYFFFALSLHPDELCSYLFFARQGFLVTATNYVLPNNHVFFNIICSCLSKLPGLSPKAVMRLPSLAGDLALLYGVFCLFRRWGGFQRAILVVAGVGFCYLTSVYAVEGRGYQLQEVCALISGLACWECFCGKDRYLRRKYALFIVFSVAGLYINPVFLYHFTALVLMTAYYSLKGRDYRNLLSFGRAVLLIGVITFILYLPLVLASSWRALSESTADLQWASYRGIISQIADLAYDFKIISYYGRIGFWFMCGMAVLVLYLYRQKKIAGDFYDRSLVYFLSVAASLFFWSVYTRQYPMDRTLCFLAMALYLFFVNFCYDIWKKYFTRAAPWVFGCLLLIRAAGSMRGLYLRYWSVGARPEVVIHRMVEADLEKLSGLHPATWQITKSDDYYSMYLRSHLIENGEKGRVVLRRDSAVGEVIFWPVSYPPVIPPGGYILWGDKRITGEARSLNIYVAKGVAEVGKGGAVQ